MHFAVAPCDMHETVVPFEFRSFKKKTWNNIIQSHEKLQKTLQKPMKIEHDVTWLHFKRVLTSNWAVSPIRFLSGLKCGDVGIDSQVAGMGVS